MKIEINRFHFHSTTFMLSFVCTWNDFILGKELLNNLS